MTSLLLKISNLIYSKNKTILLVWLLLIILSISAFVFIKKDNLETELTGMESTEAYQVKKSLEKDFNLKLGSSSAIVLESQKDNSQLKDEIKNNFPQIAKIINMPSTKEHKTQLFYISYDTKYTFSEVQSLTPKIREYLTNWSEKRKIKAYFTGVTAFQYDAKTAGKDDSKRGEILGLVLSLFILIFTFGALLSAFLPLLIGITTIIFLNALIKVLGISINPVSIILSGLLGLGLAIDYSLFIVSRFREEADTKDINNSLNNTMIYSGKTILYSGLIMLCSISGLLMPDVSITKSVIVSLFIVILLSLFNSLVFLPAFLIFSKNYLNKPLFLSDFIKSIDRTAFWRKFTQHIVDRPKRYFIFSFSLLLLISLPVINMKVWSPVITIAPENSESIKGYKVLQSDGWGGELVPVNIIVESPEKNSVYSKEFISFIYDFTTELKKHEKVESVQSITTLDNSFSKESYINLYNSFYTLSALGSTQANPLINSATGNNLNLINIYPNQLVDLNDSFEIIDFVKEYRKTHTKFKILIGGSVSRVNDFTKELYNYIPQMLIIIFVGIYLLLFFHTKSVILPIKAAIMNFLPILSSFGILTMIFQYGYLSNIFNTPFNGAVTNIVPIVLFCIVFGLSMDYEVLILSRITESYQENKDVKKAIVEGMSKSSSLITGAALILLAVFIPGTLSSSPQIQEICLGIGSAILIDATIVRLFLVPSFMMLMGKWNWWNPLK